MAGRHTASWFWRVVSTSFALGALFHAYYVVVPAPSPAWRHALFVAIDSGAAWGCWRRPRWFVWAFGLLLLQQLVSHGGDLARAWPERIDWTSVLVLLGMPVVAVALWRSRADDAER